MKHKLKNYNTIYNIHIPIFNQHIYIGIKDKEEFTKFFENNFPNIWFDFHWKACTYSASDWRLCMFLWEMDWYTILHECIHLTFHIIKHCGIEIWDDEEVFAYLYEYIVKEVHTLINKIWNTK